MENNVWYTPEQLAQWKVIYGDDSIHEVSIVDPNGIKWNYIVRVPHRKDIAAFTAIAAKDLDKGLEFLIKNCTVAGDINFAFSDTSASVFYELGKNIQSLIKPKEVEIKKL